MDTSATAFNTASPNTVVHEIRAYSAALSDTEVFAVQKEMKSRPSCLVHGDLAFQWHTSSIRLKGPHYW